MARDPAQNLTNQPARWPVPPECVIDENEEKREVYKFVSGDCLIMHLSCIASIARTFAICAT